MRDSELSGFSLSNRLQAKIVSAPSSRSLSSQGLQIYPVSTCAQPRFAHTSHPGCFSAGLELFCIPDGLTLHTEPKMPRIHYFACTTVTGERLYGVCLTFYDPVVPELLAKLRALDDKPSSPGSDSKEPGTPISPMDTASPNGSNASNGSESSATAGSGAADSHYLTPHTTIIRMSSGSTARRHSKMLSQPGQPVIYAPKCLGLLSHYPFLRQFRTFLTEMYRLSLTPCKVPIERLLCNFMQEGVSLSALAACSVTDSLARLLQCRCRRRDRCACSTASPIRSSRSRGRRRMIRWRSRTCRCAALRSACEHIKIERLICLALSRFGCCSNRWTTITSSNSSKCAPFCSLHRRD